MLHHSCIYIFVPVVDEKKPWLSLIKNSHEFVYDIKKQANYDWLIFGGSCVRGGQSNRYLATTKNCTGSAKLMAIE